MQAGLHARWHRTLTFVDPEGYLILTVTKAGATRAEAAIAKRPQDGVVKCPGFRNVANPD